MDNLERIGRYETVRLLGRGGMGEVYVARDPLIDRLVAVKVLADGYDAVARERFTREARAAGRLHHENIATIFDVGEDHGRPFIAMEYVQGGTLATLIRQEPRLPLSQMLRLVEDACVGLAFAHDAGIVHLDVKPQNLIRGINGRLKVLDFGIARVLERDETYTFHVIGTVRYMAPEQLNGGPMDRRTDVYGLGCVLYEVIAGKPAFDGTFSDVITKIASANVVPLPELVPNVHPGLVRIAGRAMAPDRADRYDSLETFRHELATVRRETEADEVAPGGGNYQLRSTPPHATDLPAGDDHPRGHSRWLVWALPPALATVIGAGFWLVRDEANRPEESAVQAVERRPTDSPESNAPTSLETTAPQSLPAPLPHPSQSMPSSARDLPPPPSPRSTTPAAPRPPNATENVEAGSFPPSQPPPEVRDTLPADVARTPSATAPPDERPVNASPQRPPSEVSALRSSVPEDTVRAVLRAYEAAYDQRDVAALRTVYPNLSSDQAAAIARTFAGAVSYNVELNVLDLRVSGSTASALCDVTHALVPKIGNASTNTLQARFYFQKAGDVWTIERVERSTRK